jgi:hypothetical protein
MSVKTHNQLSKHLGLVIFWIISGLIWITTDTVAFMILPIIYTSQHMIRIREMDKSVRDVRK